MSRDAATKLACAIFDAGGSVPVTAVHALFPDVIQDEGGWPWSKLGCEALGAMLKTGMAAIVGGDYYLVEVDPGPIALFRGMANLDKTAQEQSITHLGGMCQTLPPLLTKWAAQASEAMSDGKSYDQAAELEVWKRWRQSGDKAQLSDLLRRYQPMIKKNAAAFHGSGLPQSAVDGEAAHAAMQAFENYDPMKGVKLSTYVMSYMPKIRRFVNDHQRIVRVPEAWALKVNGFKQAEGDLTSKLGRTPSSHELADHLKWHSQDVAKMRRFMQPEIVEENQPEPLGRMQTPPVEKANFLVEHVHHELANEDKTVFEHLHGLDGAKKLDSTEEIAAHTKMTVPQVNRSRTRITKQVEDMMEYPA